MIKCGVCTIAFSRETIEKAIEDISLCGAEVIEIWSKPAHIQYPVDDGRIREIKNFAIDKNIEIVALGSYLNGIDRIYNNDTEVTIDSEIKIARLLGAKIIRIWAGNKESAKCPEEEARIVIKSIQEYSEKARDNGITLVLERHCGTLTHGWWDAPLKILEMIDRGNCKLNYQVPFPAEKGEYEKFCKEDFEKLLPLSAHCHLQNYRDSKDFNSRCILSEGLIDYRSFSKIARSCGYNGAFMIEFIPPGQNTDALALLSKDIDFIKKSMM